LNQIRKSPVTEVAEHRNLDQNIKIKLFFSKHNWLIIISYVRHTPTILIDLHAQLNQQRGYCGVDSRELCNQQTTGAKNIRNSSTVCWVNLWSFATRFSRGQPGLDVIRKFWLRNF